MRIAQSLFVFTVRWALIVDTVQYVSALLGSWLGCPSSCMLFVSLNNNNKHFTVMLFALWLVSLPSLTNTLGCVGVAAMKWGDHHKKYVGVMT
mgnify:CR=1 FL=1